MYRLLILLFFGLLIRLLFIGNTGFIADISFWKSWSLAAIDHGIVWTAHNTNINYPPGFIYILFFMGKIYSLFADPHNFNAYWQTNNFLFLLVSKLPAVISDLIISCLIYIFSKKILKQDKKTAYLPLLLFILFLFNPVTIMDSALWGQVESFGLLFSLVAVILIYRKKPVLASAVFTVGIFMKLQNIIYIPLIYLFIFRYFDFRTLVKSLAASLLTTVIIIFPFLAAHDMDRVLLLLTVNSDYFPWLSLHAHNPWWLLSGGNMMASDKILVLGIINAKTLGLILFSSVYLFLFLVIIKKPTFRNFIACLAVSIFAFFLLTTQSHERYSYPVLIWLLFLIPFLESSKWRKYGFILFGLLSAVVFFNMHEGLVANYPDNGFSFITTVTNPATIALNVLFMVLLFTASFPFVLNEISFAYLLIPLIFISFAVFSLNLSYFKGKVSLTALKPTDARQDYGTPQYNRSVNSFLGPDNWNILSSNYFFYRKGIGTHANSTLVFNLDKKFGKFSTDYGVDSEASEQANVIFQILLDDKEVFSSARVGRFDFPRHIEVDTHGASKLSLIVTAGGNGISNDHADWLNPVLIK